MKAYGHRGPRSALPTDTCMVGILLVTLQTLNFTFAIYKVPAGCNRHAPDALKARQVKLNFTSIIECRCVIDTHLMHGGVGGWIGDESPKAKVKLETSRSPYIDQTLNFTFAIYRVPAGCNRHAPDARKARVWSTAGSCRLGVIDTHLMHERPECGAQLDLAMDDSQTLNFTFAIYGVQTWCNRHATDAPKARVWSTAGSGDGRVAGDASWICVESHCRLGVIDTQLMHQRPECGAQLDLAMDGSQTLNFTFAIYGVQTWCNRHATDAPKARVWSTAGSGDGRVAGDASWICDESHVAVVKHTHLMHERPECGAQLDLCRIARSSSQTLNFTPAILRVQAGRQQPPLKTEERGPSA
ncbi:hypothetical protein J6590_000314 [Homalodisca vitripennis]|nr:hypothetical protein J6590_000314 [Homalodisca vitripennis]